MLNGSSNAEINSSTVNSEETELCDSNPDTCQEAPDSMSISATPIPLLANDGESSTANADGHSIPQSTVIDESPTALPDINANEPTSANISDSELLSNDSSVVELTNTVSHDENIMPAAEATVSSSDSVDAGLPSPTSDSTSNANNSQPEPIPASQASPTKKKSFWARLALIFKPWKWRRKKKSKKMQEKVDGKS